MRQRSGYVLTVDRAPEQLPSGSALRISISEQQA